MSAITALVSGRSVLPDATRRARFATAYTFALTGMLFGAWAPRIPEIKSHLDLSSALLGVALLAPSIGSLVALGLAGSLTTRFGSDGATRRMMVLFCAFGWLPGLAPSLPVLWALMFGWGFAMGALDVSMNAQAVTVEKAYHRPVMSGFHATWSLGSLAGAGVGTLGAALDAPVALQQGVLAAALLAGGLALFGSFMPDPPMGQADVPTTDVPKRRSNPLSVLDLRLVLLGVAALTAMLSEGSVADWSGILLRDDLHARAAHVGLAYAAFMAMQTLGRLVGDRVVQRAGPARTVAASALIGSVGLAVGFASHTTLGAIGGFGLLGVGLAATVPVAFSAAAAGRANAGPQIAAVSSLAYTGFLFGPSAIGLVAQATSVPIALWMVPVIVAVGGVVGVVGIRRSPTAAAPGSPAGSDTVLAPGSELEADQGQRGSDRGERAGDGADVVGAQPDVEKLLPGVGRP